MSKQEPRIEMEKRVDSENNAKIKGNRRRGERQSLWSDAGNKVSKGGKKSITVNDEMYNQYLMAMKRLYRQSGKKTKQENDVMSPKFNRLGHSLDESVLHYVPHRRNTGQQMEDSRTSTIASMVPDEIIYNHSDYNLREYETALMFIDVSGFTDVCEYYTKPGRGGPSGLSQVLNSYIGAMVQEILTHNGDVLKFSGDAFLSMWKKTDTLTMQDIVHTAIDCALIIQKNYGTYHTDVGVVLKVKVAISAGRTYFCIIGGGNAPQAHYAVLGQPVWDVKTAEYLSLAGDVITSATAWMYVNESEYCTQPHGDGRHTKVLGFGATWRRVEQLNHPLSIHDNEQFDNKIAKEFKGLDINYREFSLRPAVVKAIQHNWAAPLRRFMVKPVLLAVDNDEPMEFLTEVRHVVTLFLNIITVAVSETLLRTIVNEAYITVCNISSTCGGLVNKVSLFDKDLMMLVIFGLRGLKREDEAQKALQCADKLKQTIQDPNILSISIGITSGVTYCGVVGHVLRREYTVIGSGVNKAARLMMSYPDKITCDKETFLRSKLDQECFKLVDFKVLKGIASPGPIYEYNNCGAFERLPGWRHPLLGRNEELRKYRITLENAIAHHKEPFTRFKDHKYGFAVIGVKGVGKTRFVEECLIETPRHLAVVKVVLSKRTVPYGVVRSILQQNVGKLRGPRAYENRIRTSVDIRAMTQEQVNALNQIFGCHFPSLDNTNYSSEILRNHSIKSIIKEVFVNSFPHFWILVIDEAQFTDDESWRIILLLLELKSVYIIFTTDDNLTPIGEACLGNAMIVKIHLEGIDRWYHSALACQILDVQAIPSDLEKVIESASNGLPGWILNFMISLVQRGDLTVVTTSRSRARDLGAIIPTTALLDRAFLTNRDNVNINTVRDADIQMAVLSESYHFDLTIDMTMDAIILKTYDSLTPFEKKLLKCSSVLGDVFSRRMLLHLMQCDSNRLVATAVAKLFKIYVLECEGGDFTRSASMVFVHPTDSVRCSERPCCSCVGTVQPPDCRDLPLYAFCGYMKFRHPLFKTTTYDLLTVAQKHDMHDRALLFLERYARRCASCGLGCFTKLLGVKCDDGLTIESDKVKATRKHVCAISSEMKISARQGVIVDTEFTDKTLVPFLNKTDVSRIQSRALFTEIGKHVRSFSSLKLGSCQCLQILQSVYSQIIDHCREAGEMEKLFEAYIEYADLSMLSANLPQAIRLLLELEPIILNYDRFCSRGVWCKSKWLQDYYLGRIHALRGACLLETGDINEARAQLLRAMELFCDPFRTSKYRVKLRNFKESINQIMALYVAPSLYVAKYTGIAGRFYEEIADCLNKMFKMYYDNKEFRNYTLAAKWSLNYALKSDSNFRLLCISYGNMLTTYRQNKKYGWCLKLEKLSMEMCRRKIGQLDVAEVQAVCYLYTSLFLFYVEYGKKKESLEFGLSVLHMMNSLTELRTRQVLVLWMLKLLLMDLRVPDMVSIMREFFYMTDHYEYSSEIWYYYFAAVILLDTGFYVETYATCEKFFITKSEYILRCKTPEATWNFFVSMWLLTIRLESWEKAVMWEEKINHITDMKFEKYDFYIMMLVRVIEGHLITLARQITKLDSKKIMDIENRIKKIFHDIRLITNVFTAYKPRYYLMLGYHHIIKGQKTKAFKYLDKAYDISNEFSILAMVVWIEHTRKHWNGTLSPHLVNYWAEHVTAGDLLDYRNFVMEKRMQLIPYTLPLPREGQLGA